MTKTNREIAYAHFRDLEANYTALPHLDKGLTATAFMKKKAKKIADALLKRNPELEVKPVETKSKKEK